MIAGCYTAAAAVFFGTVVLSVFLAVRKDRRSGFLTPVQVIFAGVVLIGVLCFFPLYCRTITWGPVVWPSALAMSLYNCLLMFAVNGHYGLLMESAADGVISMPCFLLAMVPMLASPLLTMGAVLSLFRNLCASWAFLGCYGREMYVFSALNEGSLAFARDLKRNDPKRAVVFAGVPAEKDEEGAGLLQGARELNAVCFGRKLPAIPFHRHSKKHAITFFAISENEQDNVSDALALLEKYADLPGSRLYVFSRNASGEALLSASRERVMKVHRIDLPRSLINRTLYEEGTRLFRDAIPAENGKKRIHALVLGLGDHGAAMVRALSWYCQMDGYELVIDAFDRDPAAEDRFAVSCPELLSPKCNGVPSEDDAAYTIRIHSGVAVDSRAFADRIRTMQDTTYVLVALGNDEDNIHAAMQLRTWFEQMGTKPWIQSVLFSSGRRQVLQGLRNFRGQPYAIDYIGDTESGYTECVILKSDLEADALRRHMRYGSEETFWAYEYNYRSSVALAVRSRALKACGVSGAEKPAEELTGEERDILERLEHRRWNAYMRSEGYIFSGSTDRASRNDLGKMHNDLVCFSRLSETEKRKDSAVAAQ